MAATWLGQDLILRFPTLKSGLAPLQQDISMLLPFLYEAGKQLRDSSSHQYDVSKRNLQSKPLNSDAQVGRASVLPPHCTLLIPLVSHVIARIQTRMASEALEGSFLSLRQGLFSTWDSAQGVCRLGWGNITSLFPLMSNRNAASPSIANEVTHDNVISGT